jgi:hypothetical protein
MTSIDDLAGDLVDRIVGKLYQHEPDAVAIVVLGSYAKGTARPDSDLDIYAITSAEPRVGYRTWFEPRDQGPPLHVSAGATSVDDWIAEREESPSWTFGFPAVVTARYLRVDPAIRQRLGDPPDITHPAGEQEVEDFVETVAKAKHAITSGDAPGLRLHVMDAARYVPAILLPWNGGRVVKDRRDALDAALAMTIGPRHYADDFPALLGLRPANDDEIVSALDRLARELLAFLREHVDDVDAQPDTAGYLADGTFERHLGFD